MPLSEWHSEFPKVSGFLLNARRSERLAHAYLFTGDNTATLTRVARAWVQVCACTQPADNGDACAQCTVCASLANDTYPELYTLRPQSRSRQILVDEIRELERFLGVKSAAGRLRAGVILDAECMPPRSQNAFLKTLEEPVPHTLLVLVTTQPAQLLPTIRSRCQTVALRKNRSEYSDLADDGLFDVLAELTPGAGAVKALYAAEQLTTFFQGLRDQARDLVEQNADPRWEQLAEDDKDLARKLEKEKEASVEAEYRRFRQHILDAVQTWFMQQTLISQHVPRDQLPHPDILPQHYDPRAEAPSFEAAQRNLGLVQDLVRHLSANTNERLAVESFCFQLCRRDRHFTE